MLFPSRASSLSLVIYVDEFKMSGPSASMKEGWWILQQCLAIEAPAPTGIYLGCGHEVGSISVGGATIRTLTYNMEEFLGSCVERYVELAGGGVKLRAVGTPFLHDDQANSYHGRPQPGGASIECPWCKHTFAPNHGGVCTAVPAPCASPKALFGCESFTFGARTILVVL